MGCPPRVRRGSALHAATASGVNHTVRLPRARRPASYSAQLVTRCRCFGMWRRQVALALNGTAGVQASGKGPSSYTAQLPTPTGPIRAIRRRRLLTISEPTSSRGGVPASGLFRRVRRGAEGAMFQTTWALIKAMASGFVEHDALSRGASIAYFALFSLAPLLIIVIAIASL